MQSNKKQSYFNNVFFIGLLSFFGGISQDMFVPILPLYLANVLGFDKTFIGLTEGLVTSGASLFRIVSGYLTDKFQTRKPIIFIGYLLSMISRPLLAVLSGGGWILGLRFADGVGKGAKDAPKDALIAESSAVESRGRSFGIARMLDTLGSVAGPLLLFLLLYFLKNNQLKYHYILLFTALPLVATLTILQWKVKETPVSSNEIEEPNKPKLSSSFWLFLGIMVLFSIGNSSDAFLILRAQNAGVTLLGIPLVYALFNFCYASASVPLGSLSDRIGRCQVIILGWIAYVLAYLGFGFANHAYQIWLLFAFYGLYYATTQGVAKAFVADMVQRQHRGSAYGIYNAVIGFIALPASVIAGILWDRVSPSAPFIFGAILAASAVLLLWVFNLFVKNEQAV